MKTPLLCTALTAAALLAGCGGGSAQPSESKTQSAACNAAASPAMVGMCMGGNPAPEATPGRVACRTPDAPAGFKATPPVSPDSECAAAA